MQERIKDILQRHREKVKKGKKASQSPDNPGNATDREVPGQVTVTRLPNTSATATATTGSGTATTGTAAATTGSATATTGTATATTGSATATAGTATATTGSATAARDKRRDAETPYTAKEVWARTGVLEGMDESSSDSQVLQQVLRPRHKFDERFEGREKSESMGDSEMDLSTRTDDVHKAEVNHDHGHGHDHGHSHALKAGVGHDHRHSHSHGRDCDTAAVPQMSANDSAGKTWVDHAQKSATNRQDCCSMHNDLSTHSQKGHSQDIPANFSDIPANFSDFVQTFGDGGGDWYGFAEQMRAMKKSFEQASNTTLDMTKIQLRRGLDNDDDDDDDDGSVDADKFHQKFEDGVDKDSCGDEGSLEYQKSHGSHKKTSREKDQRQHDFDDETRAHGSREESSRDEDERQRDFDDEARERAYFLRRDVLFAQQSDDMLKHFEEQIRWVSSGCICLGTHLMSMCACVCMFLYVRVLDACLYFI
jgi:hypothetical protein